MTLSHKALWTIERNLRRFSTLADVADACGVSAYHLAHAFGQANGIAVMQYVRGRRLTKAAEALAAGAPDILSLALDTGYNSHEAFSRAFRAQFGVTPEMVRRTATTEDLAMVNPIDLSSKSGPLKAPEFKQGEQILAVGLAGRHPFERPEDIPGQWQTFMREMYAGIADKLPAPPIGISNGPDDDGNFEYVCAAEVTRFSTTPRRLIELTLAPQHYAVFAHDRHVSAIGATYDAIWNEWLPTSGRTSAEAPCIERHRSTFNPQTGMGGVDIWIPLKT